MLHFQVMEMEKQGLIKKKMNGKRYFFIHVARMKLVLHCNFCHIFRVVLHADKGFLLQSAARVCFSEVALHWCRTKKELDAITVDEKELEDQIQVHGSYKKPELMNLAIIQFWFIPYYAYKSVAWHVRWLRRYQFGNEEYTQEDKEYVVRCASLRCCGVSLHHVCCVYCSKLYECSMYTVFSSPLRHTCRSRHANLH
jgi:hypothetical protein